MIHILILITLQGSSYSIHSIEFSSKQKCELAEHHIKLADLGIITKCEPK